MRKSNCFFFISVWMCLSSCRSGQDSHVNENASIPDKKAAVFKQEDVRLPPPSTSRIFIGDKDVAAAIESANNGDEQSMALLEEHYKQIDDVSSAVYWQDKLIEEGSIMAMLRKATLLTAVYGAKSCPEAISILQEAVAKSTTENERKLASEHLAVMTGEFDARISCYNQGAAKTKTP